MATDDHKIEHTVPDAKTLNEEKFRLISQLPRELQLRSMGFCGPNTTATILPLVSRDLKELSKETWNEHLKSKYRVSPESKESAEEIYKKYPHKRLPQYYPKTITLKGEPGAEICRDILKKNPLDLHALSRLAFLTLMGEAKTQQGDFSNIPFDEGTANSARPWHVLLHIKQNNPEHLDNLYHYGKILEEIHHEDYATVPLSDSLKISYLLYRKIREQFPEHPEALYALGNMADRYSQSFMEAKEINTEINVYRDFLNLEKAATLYRFNLLQNPHHEDTLFSLAEAIQANRIPAQTSDFLPEEKVAETFTSAQQAATLYRRILARNPNHIEALCNLAHLIRNAEIDAQPSDFSGHILPPARQEQVQELFQRAERAPKLNPRLGTGLRQLLRLNELGTIIDRDLLENDRYVDEVERDIKDILPQVPSTLWTELPQERFIRNFETLLRPQKNKLFEVVNNAFNEAKASRAKRFTISSYLTLVITTSFAFSFLITTPSDKVQQLSTMDQWTTFSLDSLALLTLAVIEFMIAYAVIEYFRHKLVAQRVEEAVRNPENNSIFFPGLSPEQIEVAKQVWKIPEENLTEVNINLFINNFVNLSPEQKQVFVDANRRDERRIANVKMTGNVLSILLPLGILAASSYGMYQTFQLGLPINYAHPILATEGCFAIILALMAYWAVTRHVTPSLIKLAESDRHTHMLQAVAATNALGAPG